VGSVLVGAGQNGIIVNVPNVTDRIVLSGLELEGSGVASLNGVKVVTSGRTLIENCQIRHFGGNGIELVGTSGASVVVARSFVVNNAGGFNITGASGAANV